MILPEYKDFEAAFVKGLNQVIYTRLAADLDTPVSLLLKLTSASKNTFILESVTGGEIRGRYSIIGMKPDLVWKCEGKTSFINRSARFDDDNFEEQCLSFYDSTEKTKKTKKNKQLVEVV